MNFSGPIAIGQDVPFILKVTAGATVYPEVTITDPSGVIVRQDLDIWVDDGGDVVDARIYVAQYKTYEVGIHYFKINIYQDSNKTSDVTSTRLEDSNNIGSFVTILNPIDELVINHDGSGSVGEYLSRIMSYLLLFENIGDGQCPVEIKVKNGQGVAFEVRDIGGSEIFARDILDSNGRAIVYLDKGTYKVEFYPPCGKTIEDAYKIITVNCSDSTSPNC